MWMHTLHAIQTHCVLGFCGHKVLSKYDQMLLCECIAMISTVIWNANLHEMYQFALCVEFNVNWKSVTVEKADRVILLLLMEMKLIGLFLISAVSIILPTTLQLNNGLLQKCKKYDANCKSSNSTLTAGEPENEKTLRNTKGDDTRREQGKLNRKTKQKKRACSRYQRIKLRKKERSLCSNSRRESAMSGKKMCFRISKETQKSTKWRGSNAVDIYVELGRSRNGKKGKKKINRCMKRTTR